MYNQVVIQIKSKAGDSMEVIDIINCEGDKTHHRKSEYNQVVHVLNNVNESPAMFNVHIILSAIKVNTSQDVINAIRAYPDIKIIVLNPAILSAMQMEIGYYLAIKCLSAREIALMGKYDLEQIKNVRKKLYIKCKVKKHGFFIQYFLINYEKYLPPEVSLFKPI